MLAEARTREDEAQRALRDVRRELDEATEEATRTSWLPTVAPSAAAMSGAAAIRRGWSSRPSSPGAPACRGRRARLPGADPRSAGVRAADRPRARDAPALARADAVSARRRAPRAPRGGDQRRRGDGDGEVAAELRECSQQEFGLQGELREASEAMTVAEVEATQLRGRRDESAAELERLESALGETLSAATEPLSTRTGNRGSPCARLERNRERIGPVNPLAEREYAEAREHVNELAEQRKDLERAIARAGAALIRRIDQEIAAAFEETFDATARGFEEMVAELFRRARASSPRRRRRTSASLQGSPSTGPREWAADEEDEFTLSDEDGGVEIEVTPAGKSTRRLSLLSGGEKSPVALAFVFAVLMARPCPSTSSTR